MTYSVKVKKSTAGAGEQELMKLDISSASELAVWEENTHSFILKYFNRKWKILEAGCGLGRWVMHLNQLGFSVTGIDRSEKAIANIRSFVPELNVIVGDITSMPFRDGEFDAVLSVGVVEHDPDGPEAMLREMHRVTRNDGIMILIVPIENWIRKYFHKPLCAVRYKLMTTAGKKLEFEEFRFSRDDISRRVQDTGWEILQESWVELTPNDMSYTLWVDWGRTFRSLLKSKPFKLNMAGKIIKQMLWFSSPWTIAEGIVIAAKKITG